MEVTESENGMISINLPKGSEGNLTIKYKLSYMYEDKFIDLSFEELKTVLQDNWTSVGFHHEQLIK